MKIGDRVRISDMADVGFIRQANGNIGTIISQSTKMRLQVPPWVMVRFDHGYKNVYPLSALINANEHQPMEELEISLEEIESYQEVYRKLKKEKVHD